MRSIFTFLAAGVVSAAAFAQQATSEQDHAAHHPEGAASAPAPEAQKPGAEAKEVPSNPKTAPGVASGGMGMDADMGRMHEEAHKPGGMHDQMHGKDSKMMGGPMSAMPPASAASK